MSNAEWIIVNKLWVNGSTYYKAVLDNNGNVIKGLPLEVSVVPKIVKYYFIFVAMICSGIVGGLINENLPTRFGSNAKSIQEFSKNELNKEYIVFETIPTEIELVIDTPKNIGSSRIAYAQYLNPCRITIPSGMKIIIYPKHKYGDFLNKNDSNTIAHEIAHCIKGNWHD